MVTEDTDVYGAPALERRRHAVRGEPTAAREATDGRRQPRQAATGPAATDSAGQTGYTSFDVSVQNHLKVDAVGGVGTRYLKPNETVTLQATASADDTTGMTFQWYAARKSGLLKHMQRPM